MPCQTFAWRPDYGVSASSCRGGTPAQRTSWASETRDTWIAKRLAWNLRIGSRQPPAKSFTSFAFAFGQRHRAPMYLVELYPGTEVTYSSLAELSAAIRGGDVRSQARIFHRRSSTWVSITVHPEYRRLSVEFELLAMVPLKRKRWTFFDPHGGSTHWGSTHRNGDVEPAPATEASRPEPDPIVVSHEEKTGVRQLMRGAMRWLRRPPTRT